ncbi:PH domain-containing protein [Mollicutes bacterium LVI A0039]|nr:PH domain-containing protein [Mollicutes bacterium LVI A0039]
MKKYIVIKTLIKTLICAVPIIIVFAMSKMLSPFPENAITIVASVAIVYLVTSSIYFIYYIKQYNYDFSNKRLAVHQGILTKTSEYFPVDTIQNIEFSQTVIERMCNICDLRVTNAGISGTIKYVSLDVGKKICDDFHDDYQLNESNDELQDSTITE